MAVIAIERTTSGRQILYAHVGVLLFGAALIAWYARLVAFIPDGITGGILDGARNLAEGKGLVTHSVNPAFLPYYRTLTLPLAYLWYPLVPMGTALFFRVFGPQPWCLLILPIAAYLVSGALVAEIGRRYFGVWSGVFAAAALLIQPFMIETSVRENFTDSLLVCFLLASVLAVFLARDSENRTDAWIVLAGVLLGVAQYARSAGLLLYAPMAFLVAAAFETKRLARLLLFAAACACVQAPMFVWNVRHVGTPTFTPTYVLLFLTKSFPGLSAFNYLLPTTFASLFATYGQEIARKWASQVWVHYKYFFTATSPVLLVAALLTCLSRLPPPQRIVRNFAVVLYVALVLLNSLFYWDNRYLLPVMPFVALLGVDFLRRQIAAATLSPAARVLAATAIAALVSVETVEFFFQIVKSRPVERVVVQENAERTRFLKDNIRSGDVVMVADPGLTAWETGVTAVGLPSDVDTAAQIHAQYVPFNTLLLDARRPRGDLFNYSEEWFLIAGGQKTFLDFQKERSVTLPTGQVMVLLRSGAAP